MITLTIDGREAQVPPGTLILDAAKQVGIDIPIFCYHSRMDPAAACRMCLVRIEKMPKLMPACATPVSEGMVVHTDTDEVNKAHAGVLEFLLANHPLDCPICDKGGECDLQDNSIAYGPHATRFADHKRHLDKARALGPIVELDQERCIQCTRCVRFMDEVAGDPVLTVHDRGGHAVIDTSEGRSFDSIFSGNTIEICPVGALTSRPYRFKARPWDLNEVDSVCPHCPVGCNIKLSLRHGEVKRILSRDSEEVDWGWICDRGRFGYGFLNHGERLTRPMLRKDGSLEPVSWEEAVGVLREHMQGKSGALGGGRHSLEAAHLLRRFLDEVGTQNVDHRVLPLYSAIAPGKVGRVDDVNDADLVISLDVELLEEAPVLALRLRRFARKRGLRIVSVSPRQNLLDMPHQDAQTPDVAATLRAIAQGEGELGQAYLAAQKVLFLWNGQSRDVFESLAAAVKARDGETATMVAGSLTNSYGAQAAGLVPNDGGLDARGMLEAAAAGQLDALFVVGHDILSEFPDAELAAQAVEKVPFLAVAGTVPSETTQRADLVLPVAAWAESDGHFVNMEGRAQRYYAGSDRGTDLVDDWELMALLSGVEPDYEAILAEVQAALPSLFEVSGRRDGAGAPAGGYEPAEGAAIAGASIYHKGITPDPFLHSIVPPARVAVAADVASAVGAEEDDEVEVGGLRSPLHVDPGLPPGAVLVRQGQDGANRALGRAAQVRALAGRSE